MVQNMSKAVFMQDGAPIHTSKNDSKLVQGEPGQAFGHTSMVCELA